MGGKRKMKRRMRKVRRFFKSKRGKKIMGGIGAAAAAIGLGMLAAKSGGRAGSSVLVSKRFPNMSTGIDY